MESADALTPGTELTGSYHGQRHTLRVVEHPDWEIGFQLDGGVIYRSLSAAGSAVMNGASCNGRRFWRRPGESGAKRPAQLPPQRRWWGPTTKRVPPFDIEPKLIRRLPSQAGAPDGQVKWFCSACMGTFLAFAGEKPSACPAGHSISAGAAQPAK